MENQTITLKQTMSNFIGQVHNFNTNKEIVDTNKNDLSQWSEQLISTAFENDDLQEVIDTYNHQIKLAIMVGELGNIDSHVINKDGVATKKLLTTHNAERVGRFLKRALEKISENTLTTSGSVSLIVEDKTIKAKAPLIDQIINLISRHSDFENIELDKRLIQDITLDLAMVTDRHNMAVEALQVEAEQKRFENDLKSKKHALEMMIGHAKVLGENVDDRKEQLREIKKQLAQIA